MKQKFPCDECGRKYRKGSLRAKNGELLCHKCSLRNSKAKMPIITGKVPKDLIPKEPKPRKKIIQRKRLNIITKQPKSEVAGLESIKKTKTLFLARGRYLTKNEREFLYKKLVATGFNPQNASERINGLSKKISEMMERLKKEEKSQDEMNDKFIEELENFSREEESVVKK